MTKWNDLDSALKAQKTFSDYFYDSSKLSNDQKIESLKTLSLALHSEISELCNAVNYKEHRREARETDLQKILYKSTDAYRYILAIANLWGITADRLTSALEQKDHYLHYRHRLKEKKWNGEPIVLFDIDDVLAEFRYEFCKFVTAQTGIFIDSNCAEYYNTVKFKEHGLNSEYFFKQFIDDHGILRLDLNKRYYDLLISLKSRGYWIQMITARDANNLTCFYDTYAWLHLNNIPADDVVFTPEKFAWVAGQDFYKTARLFAVDDSAKHASEYAKHGVTCVVPKKSYNAEVKDVKGIIYVDDNDNVLDKISDLILSHKYIVL